MSATIIAVANQKGGTGKTTTCENLGIGLANKGKHVLLVDTDPQASLTIALGYPRPDDLLVTLTRFNDERHAGAACQTRRSHSVTHRRRGPHSCQHHAVRP